jgi:hypothetical protein
VSRGALLVDGGCLALITGGTLVATGVLFGAGPAEVAGATVLGTGLTAIAMGLPAVLDHWCLVFQFGHGRVRHWHRPRWGIVNCHRSADFPRQDAAGPDW